MPSTRTKPASTNKGGRPRLGYERMVVLTMRVPPELRDKFYRIGGAVTFRAWLKRTRDAEG